MKILKNILLLIVMQTIAFYGYGQNGCNFMTGDSISYTVTGADPGVNQNYVLTNTAGIIQYTATSLPIGGVIAGQYQAYTVIYDNSGSAPDLSIGQDINNLSGSACSAISEHPLSIGVCDCSNSTGALTFQLSGENAAATTTQIYVLTDGQHKIISTHNSSPITGMDAGIYNLFSVVYDNVQTAPNFTAGTAITDIGGSCSAISAPLGYVVCTFDLALVKEVIEPAGLKVEDGEQVTFSIKVYNQGNIDAFDVAIKDYASSNLSYSPSQNTIAQTGNSADWNTDTTYTIAAIAAGDSAEVIIKLNVNVTDAIAPETFLNKAEIVFASETLGGPIAIDDDSTFDTDGENDIIGGDNKLANEEGDEDDHDYAWVNYNGLFDPRGFIYCDKTGAIVEGGNITVATPPGGIAYIIDDGSSGEFFFFTNNVAGIYTVTYTHPSGFSLSTNCLPQSGAFDPTGTDGTAIDMDGIVNGEVSLGVDTMGNYVTDPDCANNPYYLSFDLAPGDPFIVDNHLPVSCVYISSFVTIDQNGNDIRDSGDLPIENSTVNLFACSDSLNAIATTKTDSLGQYRFDGIPAGDYKLQFIAPTASDYTFVTADIGPDEYIDSDVLNTDGFSGCTTLDFMECDTTIGAGFKGAGFDWGDLPDLTNATNTGDYQTSDANNGPKHCIIAGLSLGKTVDSEIDGQSSTDALGDGTDENGLTISSTLDLVPGTNFRLPLTVVNTTGDTAYVEAWVDWNGDGDFEDANEMVSDLKDHTDGVFPSNLNLTVPSGAAGGLLGLRIRLSKTDNMTPYGLINSGEVEDYLIGVDCPPNICVPVSITIRK